MYVDGWSGQTLGFEQSKQFGDYLPTGFCSCVVAFSCTDGRLNEQSAAARAAAICITGDSNKSDTTAAAAIDPPANLRFASLSAAVTPQLAALCFI